MRISDWSSDVCSSDLHVGLAAAEVAALDGVVEEPVDGVAVGLVVLRRVDASLGRDRVRSAGSVVVRAALDLVALLAERGCGRGAGEHGREEERRVGNGCVWKCNSRRTPAPYKKKN